MTPEQQRIAIAEACGWKEAIMITANTWVEKVGKAMTPEHKEQIRERWKPGARLTTWGPKAAAKDITALLDELGELEKRVKESNARPRRTFIPILDPMNPVNFLMTIMGKVLTVAAGMLFPAVSTHTHKAPKLTTDQKVSGSTPDGCTTSPLRGFAVFEQRQFLKFITKNIP